MTPAVARALLWAPISLAVAVAMDFWAAFVHGRIWHGALWPIHASHHRRRSGVLEANDLLSTLHAPLAIALVLAGCRGPAGPAREIAFGVGLGMSVFGVAYVLVHDGLAHRRLPVGGMLRLPLLGRYLVAVVRAHRLHHGRGGGPPFGLFFGPWERTVAHRLRPRRSAARAPGRAPSARGS